MRISLALPAAVLAMATGCSIVYDSDVIRRADSPLDGPITGPLEPPADKTATGDSSEPDAPSPTPAPTAPSGWVGLDTGRCEEYEVQPVDTLSEIAMHKLGTMHNVPILMLANPKLTKPEMVWKGQKLLVPAPDCFVSAFLRKGETASTMKVLRYDQDSREGYVGVEVESKSRGDEGGRFLAVHVKSGKARLAFDSSGQLPAAPAGAGGEEWSWRALDLDNDRGLDLVFWRSSGTNDVFQACVFQETPDGYVRHVLTDGLYHGRFADGKPSYRNSELVVSGDLPAGRNASGAARYSPGTIRFKWSGRKFTASQGQ